MKKEENENPEFIKELTGGEVWGFVIAGASVVLFIAICFLLIYKFPA